MFVKTVQLGNLTENNNFKLYTVKSFSEFINKLIDIFPWIMVSMIPFVANAASIYWFAMDCLVLIREIKY